MSKVQIIDRPGKRRVLQLAKVRANLPREPDFSQNCSLVVVSLTGREPINLSPAEVIVCSAKDIPTAIELVGDECGLTAITGIESFSAVWNGEPVQLIPLVGGGVLLCKRSPSPVSPQSSSVSNELQSIKEQINTLTAKLETLPSSVATTSNELTRVQEKVISALNEKLDPVIAQNAELRKAREKVEQVKAADFFRFALKVDSDSFRICAAVMVHGDVAKAGRALGIPDSTMRSKIKTWESSGHEYQTLLRFVAWRKSIKVKLKSEAFEQMFADRQRTDYSEIVEDVLEELSSFTDVNWKTKATELEEILRSVISR